MKILVAAFSILTLTFSSAVLADNKDPQVVKSVDLNRYMGRWYEIAHSPNFFQGGCLQSTAEYALKSDGTVSVYNVCYKAGGQKSDISGTATVPDSKVPAKLKVRFNFFAQGDYWIVELDPNYEWAVVSSPKKSSTFILARRAPMAPDQLKSILATLTAKGFETQKFIFDKY